MAAAPFPEVLVDALRGIDAPAMFSGSIELAVGQSNTLWGGSLSFSHLENK